MEADDLLCSRNARPLKALVGRAQWKINQPPSLKREKACLEGWDGQPGRPPARGTRTIRMCSFDARTRGSTRLPCEEKNKRAWKDHLEGWGSLDARSRGQPWPLP